MMVVDATTVKNCFLEISKIKLEDIFAEHCVEICEKQNLDPVTLANEWDAFSMNRGYEEMTLQRLDKLSDVLEKKTKKLDCLSAQLICEQTPSKQPVSHNLMTLKKSLAGQGRRISQGKFETPIRKRQKSHNSSNRTNTNSQTPPLSALQTPVCHSAYAERRSMGKVEVSFNPDLTSKTEFSESKSSPTSHADNQSSVQVELIGGDEFNAVNQNLYMYSTLEARSRALDSIITAKKAAFSDAYGIREWAKFGYPSQEKVFLCGRICCETAEGRLNATSVQLEGSLRDGGMRLKVDLKSSDPKGFTLFPGQIAAVKGICTTGHTIIAEKIYTSLPSQNLKNRGQGLKRVHCFVASGPFTTSLDLNFEPLEDLLAVVRAEKPDVLILLGPFIDTNNPLIASGKSLITSDNDEKCEKGVVFSFQEIYEIVTSRVSAGVEDMNLEVILVPSTNDAFHHDVFPQPPLTWPSGLTNVSIHLMPNPCTFRINQVVFGICTNDILFHLSKEELSVLDKAKPRKDRLSRLADCIIGQRSFYPLFPPAIDSRVNILEHTKFTMPITPDILILPSRLSHFVKKAETALCLNPGLLTKGSSGGVYGKLMIEPLESNGTEENKIQYTANNFKVEIVRI